MHSMRSLYSPRDCLQLCLLAPSLSHLPDGFANVRQQADVYDRLLTDAQRLRGRIYQAEGAISAEAMDAWDRYVCPQDTDAWHILLRDGCGHVRGAMRITFFRTAATVPIERLHAFDLVQRAPDPVRQEYSDALQSFLNDALLEKPFFFEAGGLVLDTEVRNSRRSTVLTAANWSRARRCARSGCRDSAARLGGHSASFRWVRSPYPFGRSPAAVLRFLLSVRDEGAGFLLRPITPVPRGDGHGHSGRLCHHAHLLPVSVRLG
jgi:hypothetical protein